MPHADLAQRAPRAGVLLALAVIMTVGSGCGSSASAGPGRAEAGDDSTTAQPDAGTSPGFDDGSGDDTGSDTSTSSPDSAPPIATGDATTYFLTAVQLQGACSGASCLCLRQALPVDPAGLAACEVFLELAAGDTCDAHGLAAVAPDVLLSVTRSQTTPPPGPVCVLPQLPMPDWVNGSCDQSTEAGWCYLTGGPAGSCAQVVRASPTGVPPTGAVAILGCGGTPGDAGPDGDVDGNVEGGAEGGTEGGSATDAAASVGSPCTPSLEGSPTFGGFQAGAVTLDEANPACPGAVCLVNHFQGLTSCPYGQDSQGRPSAGASTACTVPGTSTPVRPGAIVGGETVEPWCADRRASGAVECSCRCASVDGTTSDGASYCACPAGFTCTQVVPAVESGDPRAGGYCIRNASAFDPSSYCHATCDVTLSPCQ
jgi:hypothetical protein